MKEEEQMSFSMTIACVHQAPTAYSNYANVTLAHMKLACPVAMLTNVSMLMDTGYALSAPSPIR